MFGKLRLESIAAVIETALYISASISIPTGAVSAYQESEEMYFVQKCPHTTMSNGLPK